MKDYIKREMLEKVKDHLEKDEISLIVGARQVGKTTLMKQLKEELEENGENTLYLSMDIQKDRTHFESQQDLIDRVELEFGDENGYVFLDEIQRKEMFKAWSEAGRSTLEVYCPRHSHAPKKRRRRKKRV